MASLPRIPSNIELNESFPFCPEEEERTPIAKWLLHLPPEKDQM